jgi:hypothetical protein
MDLTISIALISAIAAGLACWAAHPLAKYLKWGYVPRYALGVGIGHLAYAFVIFSALPLTTAAILYGLLWLIYGAQGLATWIAHQHDPDPKPPRASLTPEADRMLRQAIDEGRDP